MTHDSAICTQVNYKIISNKTCTVKVVYTVFKLLNHVISKLQIEQTQFAVAMSRFQQQ